MQRWSSRISSTNHDQKLRIRIKNRSCLFTWKFSFKTLLANILCYGLGVHLQIVCRMDSAAWSCVPWFVFNLEALFFSRAANIRDSGLGVLHNCNTPHDGSSVDLESAATMNNVTASGVLFHACTMPHDCFRIVVLHNCTMPNYRFPVDVGSAASMINVTASGALTVLRLMIVSVLMILTCPLTL